MEMGSFKYNDDDKMNIIDSNFPSPMYNDDYYKTEYLKVIEATNLEGRFQQSLSTFFILTFLSCNFITILFAILKVAPMYKCIGIDEFEDTYTEYDKDRFKVIVSHHGVGRTCVNDLCREKVNSMTRIEPFDSPLLAIVDLYSTTNFNFLSKFYSNENFCFKFKFIFEIIRWILYGSSIGHIAFPFITEYAGRRFTWLMIVCILIISNIMFILITDNLFIFKFAILIFSICSFFNIFSHVARDEILSKKLSQSTHDREIIFLSTYALVLIFITVQFQNFTIPLVINLFLIIYIFKFGYSLYIIETPIYLLQHKQFKKLRESVVFLASENFTYDFLVKIMLLKLDKQKRFSKELLKIELDVEGGGELNKNKNELDIKKTLCRLIQGLIIYIKNSGSDVTYIFKLFPLIYMYSSIYIFQYGQLLFLDIISGILQNKTGDLNINTFNEDNFYIICFLFFLSKIFSQIIYLLLIREKYSHTNTQLSVKKLICINFLISAFLSKLLTISMSFYYLHIACGLFFLLNTIGMLNGNLINLHIDSYFFDKSLSNSMPHSKRINLLSISVLIGNIALLFSNFYLFAYQSNPYFIFCIGFIICALTSFLSH
jgi:hypothetical protein